MAAILNVMKEYEWYVMAYMLAKAIEPAKSEHVGVYY